MEIILTSRNPSKVLQIQTLFGDSRVLVRTQEEMGVVGEALENGKTLEENARKKIAFARTQLPRAWLMADDTGLFIDALGGEPGIQAAYWGGESLSVEERMFHCLDSLKGISNRRAIFRTVVVVSSPAGEEWVFVGEVPGALLEAPRVAPQPKMPYGALFVPEGDRRSWAEMTTEEENVVSHRGKAFRAVLAFLETVGQ